MPYDLPDSFDGLGQLPPTPVPIPPGVPSHKLNMMLRQRYAGLPKKRRLDWLKKTIARLEARVRKFEAALVRAKKPARRKRLTLEVKAHNYGLNMLNQWLRKEEQRLGLAPPVEAATAQQVDVAIEEEKKEVATERVKEIRERTAPTEKWLQREERARNRRIYTPLTEMMTKIEASTEGVPFRMRLKPTVENGIEHTDVEIEALDVSPDAVKSYSLFRRDGDLVIEPITEAAPAQVAGLGQLAIAVAAAPEIAQTVAAVGQEELSKIVKQAGTAFNLEDFIKLNLGDIKKELSDKVHKLTGGLLGKKKKEKKWYHKHGWKNKPPKDVPRYRDKRNKKHCLHRVAWRLWGKLGKPRMAYGPMGRFVGMRALEVLVGVRGKKAWIIKVPKKFADLGATPYDAIKWAQVSVPGFEPAAAGVPTEAVTAKEIEAANIRAGENAAIAVEPPLLETTAGKVAVGGGAYLLARALGLF